MNEEEEKEKSQILIISIVFICNSNKLNESSKSFTFDQIMPAIKKKKA